MFCLPGSNTEVERFIPTPEGDPLEHLAEEVVVREAKNAGNNPNLIINIIDY